MRRVNILGVEISAVNKETAIQYLLENMDKARENIFVLVMFILP